MKSWRLGPSLAALLVLVVLVAGTPGRAFQGASATEPASSSPIGDFQMALVADGDVQIDYSMPAGFDAALLQRFVDEAEGQNARLSDTIYQDMETYEMDAPLRASIPRHPFDGDISVTSTGLRVVISGSEVQPQASWYYYIIAVVVGEIIKLTTRYLCIGFFPVGAPVSGPVCAAVATFLGSLISGIIIQWVDGKLTSAEAWGLNLAIAVIRSIGADAWEFTSAWAKANMRPLLIKFRDAFVEFAKTSARWAGQRIADALVWVAAQLTSLAETIVAKLEEAAALIRPNSIPTKGADPSTISVGGTYYSVEVDSSEPGRAKIFLRTAAGPAALPTAPRSLLWADETNIGEVWAPEIVRIDGRYYVYFSAGRGSAHRMYVISSTSPWVAFTAAQKLNLPDDKWAIDGTTFTFNNQRWFVWSGWVGDADGEQTLFISRMNSPTQPTGARYVISQPREPWEQVVGNPTINEGPEAVKDPNGQLHIAYSANGSWSDQYCIADLRLRAGGDPTYVWDWYKSNGCEFGSNRATMMPEWDPTLSVNGPGHHTFVLENGDINSSPGAGHNNDLMYHAVPKGIPYSWDNRRRFAGGWAWRSGCTYSRQNVPGDNLNTGWSIKFFEDRNFGNDGGGGACTTNGATTPGRTGLRAADPSVMRVGSTYYSVESDGGNIYSRSAASVPDLARAPKALIWSAPKNMPNVWAPELVKVTAALNTKVYAIYFASGDGGAGQRMYYTWSNSPDRGFSDPIKLNLPDDKWSVDGTAFYFGSKMWFVWSGWEGDSNIEQNIYIAEMTSPSDVKGPRKIISQAREPWERIVGNPYINEAPAPLKDPNGQLHITYSANGSWSDQYCIADLRLRAGGDPMYVWDWYKSNGCLFGSNRDTMMAGWDPALYANGPGSHSFVLLDGDIGTSPPAGKNFPLMYHAVPKGTAYSWANREWFSGGFGWRGGCTYSRQNVPGANTDTGWSIKFFEDRYFGNDGGGGVC
ncbi:GH43 family beta-xylosidase [Actinoplanes tereljensis]|uniref:GH43 family beta-xylosidase n=1 Tax=Paractinoplanes tereljensis TaxID=571912 RepID=A0A919NT18_9ACTN|nr:glycoside hydrolase family 43 protein [Actinoplanes tereljensis]GIF23267.1 hypothetical protein Ate02nite_59970 [Actinoplanes tereljensis]